MGGPRASSIRRREQGKVCCRCELPLDASPWQPWGERYCDRCQPPRKVYMHFFQRDGWIVQFLEPDMKTAVGRIRTFGSADKLRELIARTPTPLDLAAKEALSYAIERGRGGIDLLLTREQYLKLRSG